MRPLAVSVVVSQLKIVVPVAAIAAVMVGVSGLGVLLREPVLGPAPLPAPQVPVLETTPAAAMPALAAMLPGRLPSPGPNQKRSGTCDPERAQVEINGGCWVETKTPPPCPRGKQWEHDGRCWLPVAEAKPVPTTGDPRTTGVADP